MRTAYLNALYELAGNDKNVLSLIADNGVIVFDKYIQDFPNQYFNFGISECEMIASAAGMASCGKIPFIYTIGAFLAYRGYEFIRNDVCLQNQNVKIVGIGAGMAYSNMGATHHTTEDIAILRVLPNLTILSPGSPLEVTKAIKAAYEIKGPVYIRLANNKEEEIYTEDYEFKVGKGVQVAEGNDITIVSTGSIISDVLKVRRMLNEENISVRVINIHTIKPFDEEIVIKAVKETSAIITVEEHNIIGGLSSIVSEVICKHGLKTHFSNIGLKDRFGEGYGTHQEIKATNGIGVKDIYELAKEILR